ncbi:MAG: hypothetical protein LBL76_03950 [Treponema sp.]|jgi:hypothetical protein|nr:hypothetical protein [Treponema sp.]
MNDKILKNGRLRAFLDGFSSAFDLSGQTFIVLPDLDSGFQKDREAIKGDWETVGNDMCRAMNLVAHGQ